MVNFGIEVHNKKGVRACGEGLPISPGQRKIEKREEGRKERRKRGRKGRGEGRKGGRKEGEMKKRNAYVERFDWLGTQMPPSTFLCRLSRFTLWLILA
jgi:hypothetical protein